MIEPFGKAANGKAVGRARRIAFFPAYRFCDLNGGKALGIGCFEHGIGTGDRGKFHISGVAD